jgi:hypothetical protein
MEETAVSFKPLRVPPRDHHHHTIFRYRFELSFGIWRAYNFICDTTDNYFRNLERLSLTKRVYPWCSSSLDPLRRYLPSIC